MRTITLTTQTGGVGKTSICASLAVAAWQAGKVEGPPLGHTAVRLMLNQ